VSFPKDGGGLLGGDFRKASRWCRNFGVRVVALETFEDLVRVFLLRERLRIW
jgi:hypothetical protein